MQYVNCVKLWLKTEKCLWEMVKLEKYSMESEQFLETEGNLKQRKCIVAYGGWTALEISAKFLSV